MIEATGDPNWMRIFVRDSRGVSIGRLSFENNELFSIKNYKRSHHKKLDETDYIFNRLNYYLKYNKCLRKSVYKRMTLLAKDIRRVDIAKKHKWREENPPNRLTRSPLTRSPLTGVSVVKITRKLIRKNQWK